MRRGWSAVLALSLGCSVDAFVVDENKTHQTWEGAGAMVLSWMAEARKPQLEDPFQSLWLDDLGFRVVRIELLPTPMSLDCNHVFPVVWMTDDLEENVAKFEYSHCPRPSVYGLVTQEMQRRVGGDELYVICSLFTPPYWMKEGPNRKFTNLGADSAGGTLVMSDVILEQYARYIVAAVVSFERAYGVKIDALSIQNEPRFEQDYNSMYLSPPQYATALARVAAEFDAEKLPMTFFGPEDVGYGKEGDNWIIDRQIAYIEAIMANSDAAAAIDAFAVHGYGGDGINSNGTAAPDKWQYYREVTEKYGLPSWQTETGGGAAEWNGRGIEEGTRGGPLFFANVIFEAMHHGNVSMWVNLMLAFNKLGQHSLLGPDFDTDNPKYAVAKHYFRWIRPGAARLDIPKGDQKSVKVTAWRHDDGTQTVVAVNMSSREHTVEVRLSEASTMRRYQTTEEENHASKDDVDLGSGRVQLSLPGESVTTLTDVPE